MSDLNYYPMPPLRNQWEAFLWVLLGENGHGEIMTDPNAHWRIVDRNLSHGESIYDFLKRSELSKTPMLWGYVANDKSMSGILVKFLTHLAPGKQDLNYIQPCLHDLSLHYHRPILDYDIVDTETPILESYTPQNIQTTHDSPVAVKEQQSHSYEEFDKVKKDKLRDGTIVDTVFLGAHAPWGSAPFETMVFTPEGDYANLETTYSRTEGEALQEHSRLVDKYNRIAEAKETGGDSVRQFVRDSYISDGEWTEKTSSEEDTEEESPHKSFGINAVEIDPGEYASHEDGERPFIYHHPSNTLFYTTKDSHHANIIPKIHEHLVDAGYTPSYMGEFPGPWIFGDITEPFLTDRNWIKFISSENGKYPESVISYLRDKFGEDRHLVYNGPNGWDPLPESFISKVSTVEPVPREQRLKEWRWSYDPETKDIQAWEVNDGYPSHVEQTGMEGPFKYVQGRIYLLPDKLSVFYWKDRPMMLSGEDKIAAQCEGWDAIQNWITQNKIRDMIPDGTDQQE